MKADTHPSETAAGAAGLSIEQTLSQAVTLHQQGQLPECEALYRAILQQQPQHADANHNLGILALQLGQPAAALPLFKTALEACPSSGQFWISFIDALLQAGHREEARQVLEQGRQFGLQGEAVALLAERLAVDVNAQGEEEAEPAPEAVPSAPEPEPQPAAVAEPQAQLHAEPADAAWPAFDEAGIRLAIRHYLQHDRAACRDKLAAAEQGDYRYCLDKLLGWSDKTGA